MKPKDKELLLRYLSMAWNYGVYVHIKRESQSCYGKLTLRDIQWFIDSNIEVIKPYLRPLSSMTKEEEKEFYEQIYKAKPYSDGKSYNVYEVIGLDINYLNAHHFDYFGLIEKGFAIEVTKENNPYI